MSNKSYQTELKFQPLQSIENGLEWDNESSKLICSQLQEPSINHTIKICSAKRVFENKISPKSTNINWLDFDKENIEKDPKLFEFQKQVYDSLFNQSLEYILKKFRDDGSSKENPIYLAVIEQDGIGSNLIRGIWSFDGENIKIAVNPIFLEYKPITSQKKYNQFIKENPSGILENLITTFLKNQSTKI